MNRLAGLVFVLLATMAVCVEAAPSCTAQCVRRMAECRATHCAGLSRRSCRDQCRAVTGCAAGGARIGTLAGVVTECRSGPAVGGWTIRQRFEVRRGDCAPVVIKEVETPVPVPDPFGVCLLSGLYRSPVDAVLAGVFQRIEVSPDGRSVVFELTDDHVFRPVGPPRFSLEEEGIFVVRADGTRARTLGAASRQPKCTVTVGGEHAPGVPEGTPGLDVRCDAGFEFSPDGKLIVFTDRGPGTDGSDAAQLVTLDVRNGDRTQVTRFVAASQTGAPPGPFALFVDNDTIKGFTALSSSFSVPSSGSILFTVKKDGSGFRTIDLPTIGSGGQLVPVFGITGRPRAALVFTELFPGGAQEIFVKDHRNMLQVTHFGRADTQALALSPAGKRIFFEASADPFDRNRMHICQIFSIDQFGGDLRQLTDLRSSAANPAGCSFPQAFRSPSCAIAFVFLDTRANTLLFGSSCDPFGANPQGMQWFAVRTDGSGLRQITNYRGMEVGPDGTVTVELPLPTDYAERNF